MNHFFQLFFNKSSLNVDYLRFSINPDYSIYLDLDFVNQKTRITLFEENKPSYIHLNKLLTPDFPKLIQIKKKVSLYTKLS